MASNEEEYTHEYEEHDSSRPHSIDLTLELEHQLNAESLPSSPVNPRPQSLDHQVLASIVTQLRFSLAAVTKERDDLANVLAEVQARETSLKDALHHVSEKCIRLEGELASATDKSKEDQDAVSMLRSKLEDSRRALMRLQTESRRMSQASNLALDLSRAGPFTINGPPSSKRNSFAPLTGSSVNRIDAHRRISSVSDSGLLHHDPAQWATSPRVPQVEPLQSSSCPPTTSTGTSRRISGFFGRAPSVPLDTPPAPDTSELVELRNEMRAIKEQLEETRHELTESREAQEASETCAQALRTFISENSIGMHPPGSVVHPSPQRSTIDETASKSSTRWGFKLWNTPASTVLPVTSPALPPLASASSASAPPAPRKLGGFFASRASISSTSSAPRPEPHSNQQEPIYNGSDSSSDDLGAEPVSPASELPRTNVIVRSYDGTPSVLADSPKQTKTTLEQVGDHNDLVVMA